MTFLNTFFLSAFAAAALPILIHILSRRRLPLIPFSSIEFLQKLQKRRASRIQLRQLILLALRVLAVAAVVAAFARPAIKSVAAGTGSASETVIIVDDALASGAQTRDGSILGLNASCVKGLLSAVNATDRVTLLTTSLPTSQSSRGGAEKEIIGNTAADLLPRFCRPDLPQAFSIADSILRNSTHFNRELFVVSSFYGAPWDSVRRTAPPTTRLFLLPTGPAALTNVAVENVRITSALRQAGRPVDLEATFRNYSTSNLDAQPVSIYLDGERVAQGSVDIPADGTVNSKFVITPAKPGLLGGSVRFDNPDALSADNRRHFVLEIPERIRLLVVCDDTLSNVVIRAVLGNEGGGFVHTDYASTKDWEARDWSGYDAMLVADIRSTSTGAVQRVVEFVEHGGGLVLLPGTHTDLADLNRGVLSHMSLGVARGELVGGVTWGKFDTQHTLFSDVFEKGGNPKAPTLTFAIDYQLEKGTNPIIPLSNGTAFLAERAVGKGRILLFASPPSPVAGDFVFAGIFAPLMYRAVAYSVTAGSESSLDWETGSYAHPILNIQPPVPLKMIEPDGDETIIPPRPLVGGAEYVVGKVMKPGTYTFKVGEDTKAVYAANVPQGISRLSRVDTEQIADSLGGGYTLKVDAGDLDRKVAEARFGRELWLPIAGAFLGLLVAEGVIGRGGKDEGA